MEKFPLEKETVGSWTPTAFDSKSFISEKATVMGNNSVQIHRIAIIQPRALIVCLKQIHHGFEV